MEHQAIFRHFTADLGKKICCRSGLRLMTSVGCRPYCLKAHYIPIPPQMPICIFFALFEYIFETRFKIEKDIDPNLSSCEVIRAEIIRRRIIDPKSNEHELN
jgi:hypothetical protein